jgi:cell division protein ZapE
LLTHHSKEIIYLSYLSRGLLFFLHRNIKPSNLYLDGLHRDRFLPFIDYLENDCLVININSGKDYRKNRIIDGEAYYSPLGNSTRVAMDKIFKTSQMD